MSFEKQAIDPEMLPLLQRALPNFWGAYGGMWAGDEQTGDCLYFSGADPLDPAIPKQFTLLTNGRQLSWRAELIEARYVPDGLVAQIRSRSESAPPDFVAVIRSEKTRTASEEVKQKVRDGLAALLAHETVDIAFLEDWSAVDSWTARPFRERATVQQSESVSSARFFRELKPIWLLLGFGVLALALEALKQ